MNMTESRNQTQRPLRDLLRVAAAGARGTDCGDLNVDWQSLVPLAAEQGITGLVVCAVLKSPRLACPDPLKQYLLSAMRTEASVQLIRQQRILHLLDEMKQEGIETKLLKGYAVGRHYAHPECRGSVDTDLLIDIRAEKKAIRFLEERGFRVSPRAATSQHAVCQHKKYGMVELHVAPYAELIREIWFQGLNAETLIQEACVTVETPDGSYTSLGYTDHLIFLTLHMAKHFILSGLTVRMMLDIALFFSCNKERIDSKRFWDTLNRLGYAQLVNCILWAVILYGGFRTDDFPGCAGEAPEQIPLIFDDLLEGGYMGARKEKERYAGGMEYNRQLLMKNRTAAGYRLYMWGWKIKGGMKSMFPSRKTLAEMYPLVKKSVLLTPIMRVYHMFAFPIRKLCSDLIKQEIRSNESAISPESRKRLELFRELKML